MQALCIDKKAVLVVIFHGKIKLRSWLNFETTIVSTHTCGKIGKIRKQFKLFH